MNKLLFSFLFKALAGARSNAREARQNAQEAQIKYAEQASKDADIIRRNANETKTAAHQLRSEADHLNGRVVVTENRIAKLSDAVKEDNALTDEAKEKVSLVEKKDVSGHFCQHINLPNYTFSGWTSQFRFERIHRSSGKGSQRSKGNNG